MASLKEGEWSCYRGGQFKEWSCYRGGLMEGVVTEVSRLRENGHVTEVIYHFKEGITVILERWPV